MEVKKEHPHSKECESFEEALKHGFIVVINGEPQIKGKLPEGAEVGNILTGETYDPSDFVMNMVVSFCPFCGKKLTEHYWGMIDKKITDTNYFTGSVKENGE